MNWIFQLLIFLSRLLNEGKHRFNIAACKNSENYEEVSLENNICYSYWNIFCKILRFMRNNLMSATTCKFGDMHTDRSREEGRSTALGRS